MIALCNPGHRFQPCGKYSDINWLAKKIITAAVNSYQHLLRGAKTAEEKYRPPASVPLLFTLPNSACHLITVKVRHFDVKQDQVDLVMPLIQQPDGLVAAINFNDPVTNLFQLASCKQPFAITVIYQ
ncbi:hypothetical protein GCM10009104_31250 [Marinobacterium maritimum]|uniref:Uncharacterized protein n=1 Tax=Marinobacterium maritimum TaxID=500162 RepID=A0ABP3TGB8_9GAMM